MIRETLRRLENRLFARIRDSHAQSIVDQEPGPWVPTNLHRHKYCLLISFRRSGAPVATPVWFGLDGEQLYLRSGANDGKIKRIRRDPTVLVAPCSFRGRPLGGPMRATARILSSAEEERAERALRGHYGLGRRLYRSTRGRTVEARYLEVFAPQVAAPSP